MDGVAWNGSSFICSKAIDGGIAVSNVRWEIEDAFSSEFDCHCMPRSDRVDSPVIRPMTVLLSDIARPAKQRGEHPGPCPH